MCPLIGEDVDDRACVIRVTNLRMKQSPLICHVSKTGTYRATSFTRLPTLYYTSNANREPERRMNAALSDIHYIHVSNL